MTKLPEEFIDLLEHLNEEALDPDVGARELYDRLKCRMPYGLWLHNEVKKVYDEGGDWSTVVTPVGEAVVLSRETALWVSARQRTELGTKIRKAMVKLVSASMRTLQDLPGYEDICTFSGMVNGVQRFSEERERLKSLFS